MQSLAFISFGLAALAYIFLALILLTSWRGKRQGALLIVVSVIQVLWAGVNIAAYSRGFAQLALYVFLAEVLRTASWFFFIGQVFDISGRSRIQTLLGWSAYIFPPAILFLGFYYNYADFFSLTPYVQSTTFIFYLILYSLFGLVLLEQFYRNSSEDNRWRIKFLVFSLAVIFAYDFFLYTYAFLMQEVDPDLWLAKGIVNAVIVPFVAISAARNPSWSLDVFVSRKFAFYTTSFVAAGAYLLFMGGGGYYVRQLGGSWGVFLEAIFLVFTALLLFVMVFSGSVRAWIKVFVSKNFYNYKYDYRDEWLRLMRILSSKDDSLSVNDKAIKSLAQIVESPGGLLWYLGEDHLYHHLCDWNVSIEPQSSFAASESLFSYLRTTGWIIDLDEYRQQPEKYGELVLPDSILLLPDAWLVIPLSQNDQIDGVVVLMHPRTKITRTWEDLDLLKTVATLVASYLAQHEASRKLVETQQFAAFNRLSAFVVHDLNNLVAQLSLVVKNAEKHKSNPAFMDDAIKTVQNAVNKMDHLLTQLRKGRFEKHNTNQFDLNEVIKKSIQKQSNRQPVPIFSSDVPQAKIEAECERFCSVLEHLIRNSQDATGNIDGKIYVRLKSDGISAFIEIEDNGCGMDNSFIKERLYKPFETTKGNAGMGIGVYESKQFIQEAGGSLMVESEVGKGTIFILKLPLVLGSQA